MYTDVVVWHYLVLQTVFSLEKTFKTTFSLLVLHMWLCLRRLKGEGKEGVELGQYLYEIYNHDLELRVSKAGVSDPIFISLSEILQSGLLLLQIFLVCNKFLSTRWSWVYYPCVRLWNLFAIPKSLVVKFWNLECFFFFFFFPWNLDCFSYFVMIFPYGL